MKTLGFASTNSRHKWHHNISKPAIPHVDAQFHKHSFETRHRCVVWGIDTGNYAGMGPGVCQSQFQDDGSVVLDFEGFRIPNHGIMCKAQVKQLSACTKIQHQVQIKVRPCRLPGLVQSGFHTQRYDFNKARYDLKHPVVWVPWQLD